MRSDWLRREHVDGIEQLWPADEDWRAEPDEGVRLLAPFDPIVWDRQRFEYLWRWDYRFEAYSPSAKRRFGYYALPLLYRDAVIGWANVKRQRESLDVDLGFVGTRPRDRTFGRELEAELARFAAFLAPAQSHGD